MRVRPLTISQLPLQATSFAGGAVFEWENIARTTDHERIQSLPTTASARVNVWEVYIGQSNLPMYVPKTDRQTDRQTDRELARSSGGVSFTCTSPDYLTGSGLVLMWIGVSLRGSGLAAPNLR
jgi:hypothetical protein